MTLMARHGIAGVFLLAVILLPLPIGAVLAHRSGCHRWHSCPSDHDAYFREYLASIDAIESRTGLSFLPGLGPLTEELVERAVATDLWPPQ